MQIDILSLFPEMFSGPLTESIIGKAIEKDLLDVEVTDFRDYTTNKQHHVDDEPYGGGAGMLLQAQPIFDALDAIEAKKGGLGRVILLDPAGRQFTQEVAEELSQEEHLTFICGHYEGYDERGAMVVLDATVRLLPNVLGNAASAAGDSFSNGLLEYPQYTRPADFRGLKVPAVLTSGNHQKIAEWRRKESLRRTFLRRPDLLKNVTLDDQDRKWLREFATMTNKDEN